MNCFFPALHMTPVRRGYSAVPPCDQINGVPKIESGYSIYWHILALLSQFQDASPKLIHHFWWLTSRSSFSSCWNDRAWDETNQHILGGWDDNPMFFFLKTWLGTANSPIWILIMFPMRGIPPFLTHPCSELGSISPNLHRLLRTKSTLLCRSLTWKYVSCSHQGYDAGKAH